MCKQILVISVMDHHDAMNGLYLPALLWDSKVFLKSEVVIPAVFFSCFNHFLPCDIKRPCRFLWKLQAFPTIVSLSYIGLEALGVFLLLKSATPFVKAFKAFNS